MKFPKLPRATAETPAPVPEASPHTVLPTVLPTALSAALPVALPAGQPDAPHVIPFTGVPPPPPPPPPATQPAAMAEPTRHTFFHRFKNAARRPADQPPSADVPPLADIPPLADMPVEPLPGAVAGAVAGAADGGLPDARAEERETARQRQRFIELSTGFTLPPPVQPALSESEDERAPDDDDDDEETRRVRAAEGKPEEDAVVRPVQDPDPVPELSRSHTGRAGFPNGVQHYVSAAYGDGTPSVNFDPSDHDHKQRKLPNGQPIFPPAHQAVNASAPTEATPSASEMAEMFASRAFGTKPTTPFPKAPPPLAPPPPPPSSLPGMPDGLAAPPGRPTPVGWGSVYDSMSSQPMYGPPQHLASAPGPLDVDTALSDKLRRGRELGMLAVQQEEQGNMGAAEAGYINALALLVPACKELDIGSELNHHVRMSQKAKVQREAGAMLDRCEQLRKFLRANGPAVPDELPMLPGEVPKPPSRSGKPRDMPQGRVTDLPPPPMPPRLDDAGDLLASRLEGRRNVLENAGGGAGDAVAKGGDGLEGRAGAHANDVPHSPRDTMRNESVDSILTNAFEDITTKVSDEGSGEEEKEEKEEECFLCTARAQLRSKCAHTFCSSCGNQAVSVFGHCPVPECNSKLSIEGFDHILRTPRT